MPDKSQQTVLVVDDDSQIRGLVGRALTDAGYEVIQAERGSDGVVLFEMHEGQIDLVILDLVMPGQGGLDVANEITRLAPNQQILYISGYGESVVANSLQRQMPANIIMKPFSPRALVERVRSVLSIGCVSPGSASTLPSVA